MKIRLLMLLVLNVGLGVLPVVRAQTPPIEQAEISYLLDFVGKSGCELYRNGTWYNSKEAQAHLRSKYEKAASRVQVDTAEDFIAKIATKSSMSGRPYEAKCRGGLAMPSSQWLTDELARHRADGAAEAPHT